MQRKVTEWKLKSGRLMLGDRTLIVAALNITPDSVADGGRYLDPDRAFARALELVEEGADILELGAESIRMGAKPISEAEELRRLVPVLKRLRSQLQIPICVETWKPAVAEKALQYGAEIIKDPTALIREPEMAKIVAQASAGLVIQHMRGTPETWAKLGGLKDPAGTLLTELKSSISRATRHGVLQQRIVIDPGLGLGKRKEQNTDIVRQLDRLMAAGTPIQVSPSGKAFVTDPALDPSPTMATAVAVAAILRGAMLVRVHDVAAIRPAILVADEMLRSA